METASDSQRRRDELVHAWTFVLQVAGSAAALGALLYGTGAATTWIRLKESGYPPDIAVEHQSRSEMIAVGVRGFALVLGVALGVGVVVLVAARLHARLAPHVPRLARADEHLRRVGWWAAEVLGVLTVVVSAFVSWRLFGVVVTIVAGAWILYPAVDKRRWPGPRRLLGAALAVVVGAVCWQISGKELIQGVYLKPIPAVLSLQVPPAERGLLPQVPFPYFGQDSDHVYVGDIYSVKSARGGGVDWNFRPGDENSIAEIPRNGVLLSFAQTEDELYNGIAPPACSFLRRLGWRHGRPFCRD
jgi:hypothetical protein